MNKRPVIKIISASESESEESDSYEEELDENFEEIEKIDMIHKKLNNMLTYRIMQFRNSSIQFFVDSPAPRHEENKDFEDEEKERREMIVEGIQEVKGLFHEFQNVEMEVAKVKNDVKKVQYQSDMLYEKMKILEGKMLERNIRKRNEACNCSCCIC